MMQWRRRVGWMPHDLDWRLAVLFMVGSSLFAIASFPLYWQLVDGHVVGITFVLGSLFFTTAGYSSFYQTINDDRDADTPAKLWAWTPRGLLWWSAIVQLAGTLLFNVNTIAATVTTFTTEKENRLVWGPDFLGSIAFLVASQLAWRHLSGRFWFRDPDDPVWWSSLLNYLGSVFFMASAIASFTLETTDEALNIAIVNAGTFLGAICFLVGAYVLLPPLTETRQPA